MSSPPQENAHHAAKLAGSRESAGSRPETPSIARRKLFPGRPLPDPKGLINNGYMCEYTKLSGIELALAQRILKKQPPYTN